MTASLSSRTSSLAAIPASGTAGLGPATGRVSRVSSCGWLIRFAQLAFSARIRPTREPTLPGLGGDSGLAWNRLVTLCSPSESERVALALSASATDCSCSALIPTPTATDWKGGKAIRPKGGTLNLRDFCKQRTGRTYLRPELLEAVQGFPTTWSDAEASETPSTSLRDIRSDAG